MSFWVNPNNHALDGGWASSGLEKECVVELGRMYDWDEPLSHLAGGGTMANLEALWVASPGYVGKRIIASEQAHCTHTHSRITDVLGVPFSPVAVTHDVRMDVTAHRELLEAGDVGTVIATMGTTGLGAVDPLSDILALRVHFDFRLYADAAYGGYFGLVAALSDDTRSNFGRHRWC